jgi:hypothetical protein
MEKVIGHNRHFVDTVRSAYDDCYTGSRGGGRCLALEYPRHEQTNTENTHD